MNRQIVTVYKRHAGKKRMVTTRLRPAQEPLGTHLRLDGGAGSFSDTDGLTERSGRPPPDVLLCVGGKTGGGAEGLAGPGPKGADIWSEGVANWK
jgi:hypothetical protein